MLKSLAIIVLSLLFFQTVRAQKADTVYLLKKNSGQIVHNKDSADYIMAIIRPADTSMQKMYTVYEYYLNGKVKLIEEGFIDLKRSGDIIIQGACREFYPTGIRKSTKNYDNGYVTGDIYRYYPNGKLYADEKYGDKGQPLWIGCNDTTGKVLAVNGKGDWLCFNDDFSKITDSGPINNGIKDGEWHGTIGDTAKYMIVYNNGRCVSGIGYDALGRQYPFNVEGVQAVCLYGNFGDFLSKNIRYPKKDKENNIQGKVILQFIVETGGSVSHIKVIREPDESLGEEAIRVVSISKWKSALRYGMPVQSYFTLPITFSLNNGR